jgi:3-oxoacid CoA-transferase
VNYVVTDLALLRWNGKRFVLEEVAPGFTPQEVVSLTEMEVELAPSVKAMA